MKKTLIFILLGLSQLGFAMQKDEKKSDSPLRNFPLLSHLLNESKKSPTSSAGASPNGSPARGRGLSVANAEISPRKSSGSPNKLQLSKSLGKRGSKEVLAHLRDESDKIENNETNTSEQLKARIGKVKTIADKEAKKKELYQLLNIKNTNWDLELNRQDLSKEFFKLNAEQIVASLKNHIIFLQHKNLEEAENQVALCKKLFLENWELVSEIFDWSQGSMIVRGKNNWVVVSIMYPIYNELKKHFDQKVDFDNFDVYSYQETIKPEQFIPLVQRSKS
jgi:hypothetical protein